MKKALHDPRQIEVVRTLSQAKRQMKEHRHKNGEMAGYVTEANLEGYHTHSKIPNTLIKYMSTLGIAAYEADIIQWDGNGIRFSRESSSCWPALNGDGSYERAKISWDELKEASKLLDSSSPGIRFFGTVYIPKDEIRRLLMLKDMMYDRPEDSFCVEEFLHKNNILISPDTLLLEK